MCLPVVSILSPGQGWYTLAVNSCKKEHVPVVCLCVGSKNTSSSDTSDATTPAIYRSGCPATRQDTRHIQQQTSRS